MQGDLENKQEYNGPRLTKCYRFVDTRRRQVVQYGILDPLTRFLVKVEPANELQYWSLMVVHQLTACGKDSFKCWKHILHGNQG